MFKGIIYKATNIKNGKVYIGQTYSTNKYKCKSSEVLLSSRKKKHYTKSETDTTNNHFLNALKAYDKDDFEWESLICCYSLKELNYYESYYIELYDSFNTGYNSTTGGENYIVSEELKLKYSNSAKERMAKYLSTNEGLKNQREHYNIFLNTKKARANNKASIIKAYSKPFTVSENGQVLFTFNTKNECARYFNVAPGSISNRLNGKYKSKLLNKYELNYV